MYGITLLVLCLLVISVQLLAQEPPEAKVLPKKLVMHGHERVDDYYWLNERDNPEVIAYLEAENAYTRAVMAHTAALQDELFQEIKGRIKPDDASVPYLKEGHYYYTRFEKGKEYALHCRKKGSLEAEEEVMLDVNEMAEGLDFISVRGVRVSSGLNLIAFAVDTVGRRLYTIRFKNLDTGEVMDEEITGVTGNAAWAEDNRTLFYSRKDPVTLRSHRIFRHELGTDPEDDQLVYEETDETFSVHVSKTRSKKYITLVSSHTVSDEVRYLDAADPKGTFKVLCPRERGHEYSMAHYGDHFYIRTNLEARNFRLMKTPVSDPSRASWEEVIPHRDDVYLDGFTLFKDHLTVSERKGGLNRIRIIPWEGGGEHYLDFGEPAYAVDIGKNPEFDTAVVRYVYSSLTTPRSTYDYDMETRGKVLLKRDEVLGDFDSANYVSVRLEAPARDGNGVPVSLVHRKGLEKNGSRPLLLYGYGSYGASMDPGFNAAALSLLDRGFIYAIAHVRGGQELGRTWYEDGKLLKKKNTFLDFIDCAEHLVKEGYTAPEKLFAMGGSAGGLLVGAVVNMRPDLFCGAVARVPFVDVVTTMLDDRIPLTTSEYDEWGDPGKKAYYDYMLSYSPYDNVEAKDYPHLLVTTGLHDSQVQYFEPAKWVAKLRARKTGQRLLLLDTNMDAGHGGASGRYRRHRETALIYAFLLDLARKKNP
jgi:oligopeptidase B